MKKKLDPLPEYWSNTVNRHLGEANSYKGRREGPYGHHYGPPTLWESFLNGLVIGGIFSFLVILVLVLIENGVIK